MATLQYVGARYVPIFYNNPNGTWDWLSGVQYEPLTIVKYGTNTYASKKLVPSNIGSPNANPEYWAQTGDYNGAIVSLQNEVDAIQEELKYGESLQGKNILFISDSYGVQSYTNWVNEMVDWVNSNGGSAQGQALSGANWRGTQGVKYLTGLQNASNKESIKQIFIAGGVNDIYDYNTSGPSIQEFMSYAAQNCPKARVYFIFFGKISGTYETYTQTTVINAYRSIKNACEDNGIIWGENAQEILHNTNLFLSDNVHPNSSALTPIMRYMKQAVFDNFPHTRSNQDNPEWQIACITDDGLVKYYLTPTMKLINSNTKWATWYTLPNICFPAGVDQMRTPCTVSNGTTNMEVWLELRLNNQGVQYSFLTTDVKFDISETTQFSFTGYIVMTSDPLSM